MHPYQVHPQSAALRVRRLTRGQYQVIHLLAQGFSYKQIALQLNISYGTVTSHVYAATQRMGVRTAVQAVALMARAEL